MTFSQGTVGQSTKVEVVMRHQGFRSWHDPLHRSANLPQVKVQVIDVQIGDLEVGVAHVLPVGRGLFL